MALDFLALDIMQIGFASCGFVVLGTSRGFFTDCYWRWADLRKGGWGGKGGKGQDSMAVYVGAACCRGIACDAQKRGSTASVSRSGTGGEAVRAKAGW